MIDTQGSEQAIRVAIIIPTYDHARFLGDALASVAAQTRPADEVIVVDDGSHDDPGAVVAGFPGVRLVRIDNSGLGAARNVGMNLASAGYALFLDADDVLAPAAIEASLRCMAAHPGAGFVYGAHRRVDARLVPTSGPHLNAASPDTYRDFLRGNPVGMHATVLYDRAKLALCGGFDPGLKRCEDYDAYLRMARRFPVASHGGLVADYRWHDANMSADPDDMLAWALKVHARYRPASSDIEDMRAWQQGHRGWLGFYANAAWQVRSRSQRAKKWKQRIKALRIAPRATPAAIARRTLRKLLPPGAVHRLRRLAGLTDAPAPGRVNLGDLARINPISASFGFDRGTPIDRCYIEAFLVRHAGDIRGRALEIGDASYCTRFGTEVTRQDILHVSADNPDATIVGDLSQPGLLPADAFDCMVLTQTLQFIYDMAGAVAEVHRALRPGGVLLATVPGITPIDRGIWGESCYWSLTGQSARRLFGEAFGAENVEVEVHGNAYAATCFLQGLALEEVNRDWLGQSDPAFPVIVTVRACRR
ncbi:glycosyltransferase [Novosphingobium lentum]|uniref:glycosyltransferase n=1 Tax=Novosphingobium lentum TaxID=145287 RepID=UPI000AF3AA68|nr:glycosyltransferase [Novosphingobium lentum]